MAVLQGDRPSNLLRKALAVATWTWIIGDFHRIGLSFMHFLVDPLHQGPVRSRARSVSYRAFSCWCERTVNMAPALVMRTRPITEVFLAPPSNTLCERGSDDQRKSAVTVKDLSRSAQTMKRLLISILLSCLVACADDPMPKYEVQADGTVRDNETGLLWEHRASSVLVDRNGALQHCEDLRLASTVWSVPTLDELLSIREGFPELIPDSFWSNAALRTSSRDGKNIMVGAGFMPSEDGAGGPDLYLLPTEKHHVRCVNHLK